MNEDKFNNIAEIYEKYRPSYPEEYINYIIEKCNLNSESLVADIGAGTGILTRQLLNRNLKVVGVEPNNDMRNILKKLELNKRFKAIEGKAENTNLEDNSIDLIVVAQAFHWFDSERFRNECKRILKTNGKVCIMWNKLDMNSEIVKEQKKIDDKYEKRYTEVNNLLDDTKRELKIKEFFENSYYERRIVENNLINDKEKFIGSNLSKSYSLRKGDEFYDDYIRDFENVFNKYSQDGIVIIPNNTYGYLGEIS